MRLLFICGRNRRRSPTAEALFDGVGGLEACSAGLNADANVPLTADLIEWADVVFVMEAAQRAKLSRTFAEHLRGKRVVCLNIPDRFAFMDPKLVRLLRQRVPCSV